MQYYWLNKNNNKKLIVFFAGWSFDYVPFEFLKCFDEDVIVFYDYSTLDNIPDLSGYHDYTLIAWSMGVYVSYVLRDKLPKFNRKIAVNGTVYPVDDNFGIPKRTFDLTLKFVESGLQGKFYKNVFDDESLYLRYMKKPVLRTIANRVSELYALSGMIKNLDVKYDGKYYDFAIIGNRDKIIPTKNQISFWTNRAQLVDSGHFPFYNYNAWDELCRLTQK